ncbi:MAG: mechanosensitive ion channel family protein [bacterium]|nr:mechanosensitive ion channel family protein [bacterium]
MISIITLIMEQNLLTSEASKIFGITLDKGVQLHIINIVVILLIMFIINMALKALSNRITKTIDKWDEDESSREKRAKTLIKVLHHAVTVIIVVIGSLMIFREVGINITPLLTGAGIVGVAIGFGAQSIFKDFFSGFFILLENQYRVGDIIKLGEIAGEVEEINLRITKIRDLQGILHFIPNGEIRSVSNMTFHWSKSVVDIPVAYESDAGKVFNVLAKVAEEIMKRKDLKKLILEKPSITGIESFGDSSIGFRMLIKTKPKQQWEVSRQVRLAVKENFEKEGIEIPYTHIQIINSQK